MVFVHNWKVWVAAVGMCICRYLHYAMWSIVFDTVSLFELCVMSDVPTDVFLYEGIFP